MDIRLLEEGDYENILTKWWDDNNFTPPPKASLPDNGTGGFMVHKDGVNICAGFLYQTNSKMAWLEYIVADRNYRQDDRGEAIEFLIKMMSIQAKDLGFTVIYTSLTHKVLMKRYEKCGYLKGDENCTEMIKIL